MMENDRPRPSFGRFFKRYWWWNIFFTLLFAIAFAYIFFSGLLFHYRGITHLHHYMMIVLILIASSAIHALSLFIFTIVRLSKKLWLQGILLLIHTVLACCLSYLMCFLLVFGGGLGY